MFRISRSMLAGSQPLSLDTDSASSRRRQVLGALAIIAFAAVIAFAALALRSDETGADTSTPAAKQEDAGPATRPLSPTPTQLRSARLFAGQRLGSISFAVVDTWGELACYRCRVRYQSASVIKAMLLVAYLNRLANEDEPLPADHEAYLEAMIRVSDNDAASAVYAHVGDQGLFELSRQAGMADFDVSGSWGSARITAADQARFFARIPELTAPARGLDDPGDEASRRRFPVCGVFRVALREPSLLADRLEPEDDCEHRRRRENERRAMERQSEANDEESAVKGVTGAGVDARASQRRTLTWSWQQGKRPSEGDPAHD